MFKVKPAHLVSFPVLKVLGVKIILCQEAALLQAWRFRAVQPVSKIAPFSTAPLNVKTFFSLFFRPRRRTFFANLTFVYLESAALAFAVSLVLKRNSSNQRVVFVPFSSERFFASLLSFYLAPQLSSGVEKYFSCLFIGLSRVQLEHFKRYLQLFMMQPRSKPNKQLMFLPALATKNTAQVETFIKKAAPAALFIQKSLMPSLSHFQRFQGRAILFFVPRAMELYSAKKKQSRRGLHLQPVKKTHQVLFPWRLFLPWHWFFSLPAYLLFLLLFVSLKKKVKKISF